MKLHESFMLYKTGAISKLPFRLQPVSREKTNRKQKEKLPVYVLWPGRSGTYRKQMNYPMTRGEERRSEVESRKLRRLFEGKPYHRG